MDVACQQIRALYEKSNARERQAVHEQLRDLQTELSSDWEVFFGLALAVGLLNLQPTKTFTDDYTASPISPRTDWF